MPQSYAANRQISGMTECFSVNLCALYGLAVGVPKELSDGSFRIQY